MQPWQVGVALVKVIDAGHQDAGPLGLVTLEGQVAAKQPVEVGGDEALRLADRGDIAQQYQEWRAEP